MGSDRANWSARELDVLRSMVAQGHKRAVIAERLGRTKGQVSGMCYRLDLTDANRDPMPNTPKGKPWTDAELEQLRGMVRDHVPNVTIATNLGRSFTGVTAKIHALGIGRGKNAPRRVRPDAGALPTMAGVPRVEIHRPPPPSAPAPIPRALIGTSECAWPTRTKQGPGTKWEFCNAPTEITEAGRRRPYCAAHARVAYGRDKQPAEEACL